MRKSLLVLMAGLSMAASVAQGGLFNLRARLVSRAGVENTDPSADVLRVTETYRQRVAYEAQDFGKVRTYYEQLLAMSGKPRERRQGKARHGARGRDYPD